MEQVEAFVSCHDLSFVQLSRLLFHFIGKSPKVLKTSQPQYKRRIKIYMATFHD